MRARGRGGGKDRPSGSSPPPSSNITTPLHNRLHPCSGWHAMVLAALRSCAMVLGHRGSWVHCCFPGRWAAALSAWIVGMSCHAFLSDCIKCDARIGGRTSHDLDDSAGRRVETVMSRLRDRRSRQPLRTCDFPLTCWDRNLSGHQCARIARTMRCQLTKPGVSIRTNQESAPQATTVMFHMTFPAITVRSSPARSPRGRNYASDNQNYAEDSSLIPDLLEG